MLAAIVGSRILRRFLRRVAQAAHTRHRVLTRVRLAGQEARPHPALEILSFQVEQEALVILPGIFRRLTRAGLAEAARGLPGLAEQRPDQTDLPATSLV